MSLVQYGCWFSNKLEQLWENNEIGLQPICMLREPQKSSSKRKVDRVTASKFIRNHFSTATWDGSTVSRIHAMNATIDRDVVPFWKEHHQTGGQNMSNMVFSRSIQKSPDVFESHPKRPHCVWSIYLWFFVTPFAAQAWKGTSVSLGSHDFLQQQDRDALERDHASMHRLWASQRLQVGW